MGGNWWRRGCVIVAFSILTAGACGGDDGASDEARSEEPAPTSTVVAVEPEEELVDGGTGVVEQLGESFAPCADLEGCFQYEQMEEFVNAIIPLYERFSAFVYLNMPPPSNWYYIAEGESGTEPCTSDGVTPAQYNDMSYEYCPLDNAVYLGQRLLWHFYSDFGDAAAAIGILHEAGHHFQNMAGITATATTREDRIAQENQADCVAGAFTKWANETEILDYPDDIQDVEALLPEIAEAESPERGHGTLQERTQAFNSGLLSGMGQCSRFFPETPIVLP